VFAVLGGLGERRRRSSTSSSRSPAPQWTRGANGWPVESAPHRPGVVCGPACPQRARGRELVRLRIRDRRDHRGDRASVGPPLNRRGLLSAGRLVLRPCGRGLEGPECSSRRPPS
jgi:hypothetical protein